MTTYPNLAVEKMVVFYLAHPSADVSGSPPSEVDEVAQHHWCLGGQFRIKEAFGIPLLQNRHAAMAMANP
jgi:hypothetical protein